MTPSDHKARRGRASPARKPEIARLLQACARDERPALEELYKLTAPSLLALARRGTADAATAEQAVVQAYLAIFAEAASFDPAEDDPAAWVRAMLDRQLPEAPQAARPAPVKPVTPPVELWQRLDIALGLKRLDRHIKPGFATQERGRDPMPNAEDRRIDRHVRFWRSATAVTGVALLASLAVLALVFAQPWRFTASDAAGGSVGAAGTDPAASRAMAEPSAAPAAAPSPRRAVLQPADAGRLWLVILDQGTLEVSALPPFPPPAAGSLVLWGAATDGSELHRLADLDPAATIEVAMPPGLEAGALRLVVSLEPADGAPSKQPRGPVLFSGSLQP